MMQVLGLNWMLDHLAISNSVHWYGHVLTRKDSHVLLMVYDWKDSHVLLMVYDFQVEGERRQGKFVMTLIT